MLIRNLLHRSANVLQNGRNWKLHYANHTKGKVIHGLRLGRGLAAGRETHEFTCPLAHFGTEWRFLAPMLEALHIDGLCESIFWFRSRSNTLASKVTCRRDSPADNRHIYRPQIAPSKQHRLNFVVLFDLRLALHTLFENIMIDISRDSVHFSQFTDFE